MERKRTSLKDIAKEANVSTSLVSFVLNNKDKEHRISPEMAEKIRQVAAKLNYVPNVAAKSLREGKSHTIGLIVSDISNPFFANLARFIERTAGKFKYAVHFANSDECAEQTSMLAENMINRGIDGLIIVPCDGSKQLLNNLLERKIPLVLLDRYIPDVDATYVCLNNRKAGYDATRHLLENGYRHIGIINYKFDLKHTIDRTLGYEDAMREVGLEKEIRKVLVDHKRMAETCSAAISKMMKSKADSLIMTTNTISINCIHAIRQQKIIVPEQLGLVGFDGGDAFDFFYSPLSYIQQPLELMAQKAVEVLIEQIEKGSIFKQQIEYEGVLVKRASSEKKQPQKLAFVKSF